MMSATIASTGRNKFPFTATQYQELKHQAMIFKYMSAGIPIPPDLIFSIKTSLDSSLSSKLSPYHSTPLGWNPYQYQMGYGKKIDPEPGRCRRTDGKKWRCSKEAYPDSKYCERHMHRGKNRSRKPVESPPPLTNTNLNNISSTNLSNQSIFSNSKNPSSSSLHNFTPSDSSYISNNRAGFLHTQGSSYGHMDYRERSYQGLKEDVGEHAFFTENSESNTRRFSSSSIDGTLHLGEKQSSGGFPNYLQPLQSTTNNNNNHYNGSSTRPEQEKQCYIWGRDFTNCELSMKVEEERSNLNEKTTHHFFDELPIKNGGGRGGLLDDSSSTTQLSISIPSSTSF